VARHGDRIAVLEQKQAAQQAELGLAERELADMMGQLQALDRRRAAGSGAERAWRDIEAAGGSRPDTDLQDELLRARMDRQSREAMADEQLRELKKKMGKSP
jgi:hypothetical protein